MIGLAPWADQPPLEPDRPTARDWLAEELGKQQYQDRPNLGEMIDRWLRAHAPDGMNMPGGAVFGWAILIALVIVAVTILVVSVSRWRAGVRAVAEAEVVLTDPTIDAATHRRRAQTAYDAGDFTTATQEWFRAVARGLEERTILTERAGRTAGEVAREAAGLLPGQAVALTEGAHSFDQVTYGGERAAAETASAMKSLDAAVLAARPLRGDLVDQVAGAGAGAPR